MNTAEVQISFFTNHAMLQLTQNLWFTKPFSLFHTDCCQVSPIFLNLATQVNAKNRLQCIWMVVVKIFINLKWKEDIWSITETQQMPTYLKQIQMLTLRERERERERENKNKQEISYSLSFWGTQTHCPTERSQGLGREQTKLKEQQKVALVFRASRALIP